MANNERLERQIYAALIGANGSSAAPQLLRGFADFSIQAAEVFYEAKAAREQAAKKKNTVDRVTKELRNPSTKRAIGAVAGRSKR